MAVLRCMLTLLATLTFGFGVSAIAPASAQDRHIEASLAFETRTPRPGDSVTLAIRMKPKPGWHGYWTNPGAAGLPVEAEWDVPAGVTVSSLRHPAPHLLDVQGIASYVHDGPFTLLATR
jgi:DsbC/DsbD-like thiol-disulfide interchange protein